MNQAETVIEVTAEGQMRFVWNDSLAGLRDEGSLKIERASHVEPNCSGMWMADMHPVGGPELGPFPTRQEALTAELAYIRENLGL
jgi:hypothetical protein